jgi:hypothetical protein
MTHLVVQFHNLAEDKEAEYDRYLQGLPRELRPGLISLQRYRLSQAQFTGRALVAQPYRGVTLFEIDDATLLRQANLAELVRAPRRAGLLAEDRTHLFRILRNRAASSSREPAGDPDHLIIVMATYTPGMRDEWGVWYDEVHAPEWLGSPGVDAYTRGVLADTQLDPEAEQPATGLVLYHLKTHDFAAAITEAFARATGTSSTGIKWSGRSPAAQGSTTHGFDPVGPRLGDGVAR